MTTSAGDRWRMPIHDPPTFTPEVDAARATLLRRESLRSVQGGLADDG
jgi:hypothetical protein